MRLEIWSPDGMEAASVGDLAEVVQAENEEAIGLFDLTKGCRVWLNRGDVEFLREMLHKTEVGRVNAREGACEACGHPWARHSSGGMCAGDHDGDECYCVLFPPVWPGAGADERDYSPETP